LARKAEGNEIYHYANLLIFVCFMFCAGVQGIQERRADVYAKVFNKKHQFLVKSSNMANVKNDDEQVLPNASDEQSSSSPEGFKFVCYYALSSNSNVLDASPLKPNDLDAHLCTHINLAFASVSRNRLVPANPYDIEVRNLLVNWCSVTQYLCFISIFCCLELQSSKSAQNPKPTLKNPPVCQW